MQLALTNGDPATPCLNPACVVCAAATVMFTPEKVVPAGYCTVKLFVPKLNGCGAVGLSGWVCVCVVGGEDKKRAAPSQIPVEGMLPVTLWLVVEIWSMAFKSRT